MAKAKKSSETPLMKQYNAIKARYPGALLLFRVGDFYETFGEDAIKASKVLDIVLTKRANGSASHIELAGFPHHSLDAYLPRLVRAGNRVAICDQLEDPKSVKGIVKRGVTELVTPGLSMNDNVLEQRRNNFLASIHYDEKACGVSFLDLSTGEFLVSEGSVDYIEKLVQGFQPSEIIYSKAEKARFEKSFGNNYINFHLEDWIFSTEYGYEKLTRHFSTNNLKGYGVEEMKLGIIAAGAVLFYLEETEHKEVKHIGQLSRIDEQQYVWLDKFTIRNLELIHPSQSDGTALIDIMDNTQTPMGSRLLRKWMVLPLKNKEQIERRLNTVEAFIEEDDLLNEVNVYLKQIGDLERLISKVATGRINPRELGQLKKSLSQIKPIKEELKKSSNPIFAQHLDQLNECEALLTNIDAGLKDDAPINATQGNIIKDGVNEELDELRKLAFSGKDYLKGIQERETERTGISSLKIAYNKVFGYYLEVTNAHKDKVPEEWIRKQTLVNAERYITEELKVYEEKILNAEGQIFVIEQRLYLELVSFATEYIEVIQQNARTIASLDCLTSFAYLAKRNSYVKPVITDEYLLDIKEGRHPVIEQNMPPEEDYIPNDVYLDDQSQQIMIITGPNMAGKSALLRQTALIVLMAQMGCFVPAGYARVGLVDKVFTRVGASDNLSRGESTFMVEMTETASILNNLSNRSLVLMDEIGRGTSTYDGISIAWSIVEYLHNHESYKAKTLFATHYHELNELTNDLPRVKNFNVAVKELENKIIFIRKLQAGGSEHSFGIHVAQLAGMPNQVVIRANTILKHLEADKLSENEREKLAEVPSSQFQLNLFESDPRFEQVMKLLRAIDINTISPVEALLKVNEMKEVLKGKS
ncbi:MAG: DNA mismatch repair protein MutS [Flammeovirgaceae bacterium]|nr:DNA mismatch repair protein MutS [Flammeovirgaceae bacterium]MBR06082.1 DNA mismatch repair protein MutS [Rickettsiales bacterium]HCX20818.1 DNA mismatch repair protein MutS [Cytophagales bacterium]|tara:strand:+ start:10596 stop:13208 length:2613 start_codon:yes stop_codon:yes gene_type:complete